MTTLPDMLWIEIRKALRSRIPIFTLLGFMVLPLAAAFFMIVLKDPEVARKAGLISTKARLTAGTADWPAYFSIVSQGTAGGSIVLGSIIMSWIFGREFSDGTLKDVLAVPVPRSAVVLAKFIVGAVWSLLLAIVVYGTSLLVGALIQLPQGSLDVLLHGSVVLIVTVCLAILAVPPIGFFASIGRGYLPAVGVTFVLLALANVTLVAGWGMYFPWAIPILYAGASDPASAGLNAVSYALIVLTALVGVIGTALWWTYADQPR